MSMSLKGDVKVIKEKDRATLDIVVRSMIWLNNHITLVDYLIIRCLTTRYCRLVCMDQMESNDNKLMCKLCEKYVI